jgi:hypothetical protein
MRSFLISALCAAASAAPASAAVIYSNLTPNNQIAIASRPGATGLPEIETGDDFLLSAPGVLNSASFIGLLVPGVTGALPSVNDLTVEIYRVFPLDSTDPPSGHVPTRANSPSDIAFASRDSAAGDLSFSSQVLTVSFTAINSIQPGTLHAIPNQQTGGNGSITGQEVQFNVTFLTPIGLPADHYFFIPQVGLTNGGTFYWLSASRPITGAGTTPIAPDLQVWTRDSPLDPDWLRAGTDVVGGTTAPAPTFNTAFSLDGILVPEPAANFLLGAGLAALSLLRKRF